MPRRNGHINYALVQHSPRLQRLVEIFKDAPYPLSSQEIAVRAYNYPISQKFMLNVSTNIGEMRGQDNADAGYIVSAAHRWIVKDTPEENRKRCFFVLPEHTLIWHDGNPRYWLISAPGWQPRWTVSENGLLVPCTARGAAYEHGMPEPPEQAKRETPVCRLKTCRAPLTPEQIKRGAAFCSEDHRNAFWREVREMGKALQGNLF
jgi:hypothetical protein